MISYNDALLKNVYFFDICRNAASILRYYQAAEITKMLNNSKRLEAETLSELSSLSAKMRLTADIIAKEQEEELFPLLSDILKKIQSYNSAASQCYKLASAANKRAETTIRNRVGAVDVGIIEDYSATASPYKKEPVMRDAIGIINLSKRLNSLCSSQQEVSKDVVKLESVKPKFMNRHYNILLKIKKEMENKLSLLNEISTIIDSCNMAIIVVNSLGGYNKQSVNIFLDNTESVVVDNMSRIYISSLKGE